MSDGCCLLCILCYMLRSETEHHVEDRRPSAVMVLVLLSCQCLFVSISSNGQRILHCWWHLFAGIEEPKCIELFLDSVKNPNSVFSKIVFQFPGLHA